MASDNHFGRDASQAIADVFRLYVGQGRRFSMAALADATGIPAPTLKSYVSGDVAVPWVNILRLLTVLPVEAGNMLMRPSGLKLSPIEAEDDDWDGIGAEASMLTFEIFEAKADGKIDHVERAKLKKRCAILSAKLDGVQS